LFLYSSRSDLHSSIVTCWDRSLSWSFIIVHLSSLISSFNRLTFLRCWDLSISILSW
jgi:hypothetical protein